MNDPLVEEICEHWMEEIEKCGTQCQISFHYVYKKYKEYILSNENLMSKLYELKGKILGCWCHPTPCHGDILIKLLQISV